MKLIAALAFIILISGCAGRSYEGTDIGDAIGSGYWSGISAEVHKEVSR